MGEQYWKAKPKQLSEGQNNVWSLPVPSLLIQKPSLDVTSAPFDPECVGSTQDYAGLFSETLCLTMVIVTHEMEFRT